MFIDERKSLIIVTYCPCVSGLSMMSALCFILTNKSRQSIWPSAAAQGNRVKGNHPVKNHYRKVLIISFMLYSHNRVQQKPSVKLYNQTYTSWIQQKHAHTHLQHGAPSTCACAPWVYKKLDVSAARPHKGKTLSGPPGGGLFSLRCPAHPDSLTSQTANAEPHSAHNMPAVA